MPMPRYYEQKKMTDYTVGHDKYMETIYYIRQYNNNKILLQQLLTSLDNNSVNLDGMPHGTEISNPTEKIALRIADLQERIGVIDRALLRVPEEYRDAIMCHVRAEAYYGEPIFDYANINTWKKWQQRFVCFVAWEKGEGDYIIMLREFINAGYDKVK